MVAGEGSGWGRSVVVLIRRSVEQNFQSMSLVHGSKNRFDNPIKIKQNLCVPESDHPESLRFQIFGSGKISFYLLRVLAAIDLDYQERFEAAEIREVRPDRPLSAKARVIDVLAPQSGPEFALCIGHFTPQLARLSEYRWRGALDWNLHWKERSPHPDLPPQPSGGRSGWGSSVADASASRSTTYADRRCRCGPLWGGLFRIRFCRLPA
jgi:hypothetical protein